jgi:hypothetical protein
MSDFIPKFTLLTTTDEEVMVLPIINYSNLPKTSIKHTLIEGIRGIGCLVITGSVASFDGILKGTLVGNDYNAVTVAIDDLESKFSVGTRFKLKIDKTISTSYLYNIIRIEEIDYPESLRNNYQHFTLTFKVNAW